MTRSTTNLLAGVAVAALAAAGVAAVVSHRRGTRPDPDQRAHLDELADRLSEADAASSAIAPSRIGRVLDSLQRTQGISTERLRSWIIGVKRGTLSPEQADVAENDFQALEKQADQDGV